MSTPAASNSLPVKRGRGRPSKASLAAAAAAAAAAANSESLSSLGTSTYSSADSVSGYSTPLTSNVTTPAPVDNAKPASTRSTRSSNLEAASPAVKGRGSGTKSNLKADNQPTGDSLRTIIRNRLLAVTDSEDDDLADDSADARRTRHDEEVARSLQEELDREVRAVLFDVDSEEQPTMDSDSEDYAVTDPKGKGKAVATRRASGTRAAAKKRVVQDSDVDEEDDCDDDDDYSDFADLAPPAKKQKTAARGRGKQTSAKGKKPAAAIPSDSDEDLPCTSQESLPPSSTLMPSCFSFHPLPLLVAPLIWSRWGMTASSSSLPISNLATPFEVVC